MNKPSGKWMYVDVFPKEYSSALPISKLCKKAGVTGLVIRGPSQRGMPHWEMKDERPDGSDVSRAKALKKAGIKVGVWAWPVPEPFYHDSANPIIDAAVDWAKRLSAEFVMMDMEAEWLGHNMDVHEFVPKAKCAANAEGLPLYITFYRHWQRAMMPIENFALADGLQPQVYTTDQRMDFDAYPKEVYKWTKEWTHPKDLLIGPAFRLFAANAEKKTKEKWDLKRFKRHLAAMPPADAAFGWSFRQLADLPDPWLKALKEWSTKGKK